MHETGIARDLWRDIELKISENGLSKLEKVTIKLGEASGIMEDLLRHSLVDHIFPEKNVKDAEVEIVVDPVKSKCTKCSFELTKDNLTGLSCPGCGSINIEIISGNNVYVESVKGK